ncbi:restriction endonuclease [Subtercola endophyticus]|uniref:restriction endonuclease n=1 Tax=Subtercola endophyticus TaxID=2895559 RepID=UPI001E4371FE|nr:restriction endonuclease [Subtercola endophyticus]UFS57635.1 restriction endonuclease [Subtercola endophyticus]
MAAAWVIRSGRNGERDAWSIVSGVSGGGWQELPDLTPYSDRESLSEAVRTAYPELSPAALANYTGQTWALRGRIKVGDLLAMPLKTTRKIAIGRVTRGYEYLANEEDPNKRHVVRVDWERTDIARSSVKQDLLYTLGSALSIFAPSKNYAIERLEQLLATGTDPGQIPFMTAVTLPGGPRPLLDDDVDDPELQPDIADVAQTQISARIAQEFAGHDLALLVTRLLEAEGFTATQSPPGADNGIDVIAGRGILGMDSPRIIVQVKSGGQVGDPVVRDLLGVLHDQGADQGLLVSWGGISRPAKESVQRQRFKLKLWDDTDVVDAVLRLYDKLPDDIQARLPLRRVWMMRSGSDGDSGYLISTGSLRVVCSA